MTALNPLDGVKVRGVLTSKYKPNKTCAHPECSEPIGGMHHIFNRKMIGNGSFFVEIVDVDADFKGPKEKPYISQTAIPHAVGLCGSGTTGHHGDVEEHRAWIKYEDGEFVWYDRDGTLLSEFEWVKVGPLNPQPGQREGKAKRKRFKGEERKKRKVLSIRVPDDAGENGAEVWDELLDQCRETLGVEDDFPPYHTLTKVIYDWLTGGTARDVTHE
jgi:hypothetical protein